MNKRLKIGILMSILPLAFSAHAENNTLIKLESKDGYFIKQSNVNTKKIDLKNNTDTVKKIQNIDKNNIESITKQNSLILNEGLLLSQQIQLWAKDNNYKLLWNCNRDFLIYSNTSIEGKDKYQVLENLGNLFASQNYGLIIKLYEKNNVIIIDEH